MGVVGRRGARRRASTLGMAALVTVILVTHACRYESWAGTAANGDTAAERALNTLEEKVKAIGALRPVTPQAVSKMRGEAHHLMRADIPRAADLQLRAHQLEQPVAEFATDRARALVGSDFIPTELPQRLVAVADWPYFTIASYLTAYVKDDTIVYLRDNRRHIEAAFRPRVRAGLPEEVSQSPERVFSLLQRYLAEDVRPRNLEAITSAVRTVEIPGNGRVIRYGEYRVPPRSFRLAFEGTDYRTRSVMQYWTDGQYLKVAWPCIVRGFVGPMQWAGDVDTGLLPREP